MLLLASSGEWRHEHHYQLFIKGIETLVRTEFKTKYVIYIYIMYTLVGYSHGEEKSENPNCSAF